MYQYAPVLLFLLFILFIYLQLFIYCLLIDNFGKPLAKWLVSKNMSMSNPDYMVFITYMPQNSTVRDLFILFVFTRAIENSMFPRRAIFASSFGALHSWSHKHNQEKLPKWHHRLPEAQPIQKEYVLPYKPNGCTKR